MTIQQGQVISHTDYTNIKAKVDAIFGTGTGDKGYGQTVTSPTKNQGDIISKVEWDALRHDMVACRQHQTGTTVGTSTATDGSNLVVVASQSPITYEITHQYDNFADTITNDRFLISGQSTDTSVEQSVTSEWNGTINHEVTYTATSDQFRFFFNAGGQVATSITVDPGSTPSMKNIFWNELFGQIGVVWMTYTATGTNGNGTVSSIGYYDLTSTDQLIYELNGSGAGYSGSEFSNNSYKVYARKTSTTLTITVSISDTDTAGTDINVNVLPTSVVYQRRPSGSNVSVTALSVSSNTISGGAPVPQVTLVPDITTVSGGMTVNFTVTTQYILTGTTLYWQRSESSAAASSRFLNSIDNGTFTITSPNSGSFSVTIENDSINHPFETFSIMLYSDSGYTIPLGAQSADITIEGQTVMLNNVTEYSTSTVPVFHNGSDTSSTPSTSIASILCPDTTSFVSNVTITDSYSRLTANVDGDPYFATHLATFSAKYRSLISNPNNLKWDDIITTTASFNNVNLALADPGYEWADITIPENAMLVGYEIAGTEYGSGDNLYCSAIVTVRYATIKNSNNIAIASNKVKYGSIISNTYSAGDTGSVGAPLIPNGHTIRRIAFAGNYKSDAHAYMYLRIDTAETKIIG